jgi:hypothetical protein
MKRQRFAILNLALLLMIATSPLLRGDRPFAKFLFVGMFAVILISAVYAVGRRWHARMVVLPLAVLAWLSQILEQLMKDRSIAIVSDLLGIAVLLSVILLLLLHLFSLHSANFEAINAALCVYLLMGMLWSIAYSMTELLAPGSFAYPLAGGASTTMQFGGEHTIVPLYYSFVTMTTLGYGDVVPIGAMAKVLAIGQAMMGQVYLVVLVARLVGLQISGASRKEP